MKKQCCDNLSLAAMFGHLKCVNRLVRRVNQARAVRLAYTYGHVPSSKNMEINTKALVQAAQYGHAECVKLLVPVSDPKSDNSLALRVAAGHGYLECVKLLIPISCKESIPMALKQAMLYGRIDCVMEMLPLCDPAMVLIYVAQLGEDLKASRFVLDYYKMIDERKELGELVEASAGATKKSTRL